MTHLSDLKERFIWTPDGKFDKWTILKGTGFVKGDCEDFAITLVWLVAGRSYLRMWWLLCTFQCVPWLCKHEGNMHVALWRRKYGWCDNIMHGYADKLPEQYKLILPVIPPWVLLKFTTAKIIKLFGG